MNEKKSRQMLQDEFDIDDFLNNKNTAFVTVGYKDKDGQGYSKLIL